MRTLLADVNYLFVRLCVEIHTQIQPVERERLTGNACFCGDVISLDSGLMNCEMGGEAVVGVCEARNLQASV